MLAEGVTRVLQFFQFIRVALTAILLFLNHRCRRAVCKVRIAELLVDLGDFACRFRDGRIQALAFSIDIDQAGERDGVTDAVHDRLQRSVRGGVRKFKTIHARYLDQFALTDEGWRIRYREVVLVDPKK